MSAQAIEPSNRRMTPNSETNRSDEVTIHIDRTEWDGFAGIACLGHLETHGAEARPADSRRPERLLGNVCEPMS